MEIFGVLILYAAKKDLIRKHGRGRRAGLRYLRV